MKQKLRKITSVLLVVIIISVITMSPITASTLTQSEFDSKLNSLRSKYPNYSTWYSSFDGGSQCFGFARLMGYEVFGSYPSTWSVSYDFNSVKAGDIVRYGNNGSGGHSIFVTSVSGSTITFVDCNGNGNVTNGVWILNKCVVKWDNTTTIGNSLFGYSFSYIRKSPGIESSVNRTISIWGLENNHEISSATKLWAKRFDNDDNHYAVFYIDNQPITGHIQSDSSGYFSVNVDPHDYSQGVHVFKIFYANSTSSDTDEIYINIKYSISLWGLENNQEISSTTKLWAKRFDNDDNHYAVFYIDNQPIPGHIQSDSAGYFSVNVDPHDYSQGVHAFKVFYANSTSSDTDIKNIYINYDSVQGDVNLDGVINISDATTVQKLLAQLIDFSDDQKAVADTNGDGIINISDATQIQKYLAQLIPSLG